MIRGFVSVATILGAALVACGTERAAHQQETADAGGGGGVAVDGGDSGSGGSGSGSAGSGGSGSAGSGGSGSGIAQAHDHCANGSAEVGCTNTKNPYNSGEDCMHANCHGTPLGTGASTWSFAGTVYTNFTFRTPAAGIVVTFGSATATTDSGGNFYSSATIAAAPAATKTSAASMILPATGDCNSQTCQMAKITQALPGLGSGINGIGEGSIFN
jgi:hypothetical protein